MEDNLNLTSNNTSSIAVRLIFTGCYILIFILGLVGNILVCIVIVKDLSRSVTNIFLFNLSCADILNTILLVPTTTILDLWLEFWPFNNVMCKILPFLQCLTIAVTSFTYVVISSDRFFVVFYPLKSRVTIRVSKLILLITWLLSATLALPLIIVNSLDDKLLRCTEKWSLKANTIYSMMLLIMQYFVPLAFLLSTYSAIAARVWLQQAPGERDANRDKRIAKSKRKMVKMMITVSLAYAISQLPRHVTYLYFYYNGWSEYSNFVWNVVVLLQVSSTCYNPIIYCWMNESYRSRFSYYLCFVPRCGFRQRFGQRSFQNTAKNEFSSVANTQSNRHNTVITKDDQKFQMLGLRLSKYQSCRLDSDISNDYVDKTSPTGTISKNSHL